MNNPNCICITAMARHRCRYYCEGPEECDRPTEIKELQNNPAPEDLYTGPLCPICKLPDTYKKYEHECTCFDNE